MVFQYPDPKKIQINLTGFLHGKNAREFMAELWALLISAQENPAGIPDSLLDLKKEELARKRVCTTQLAFGDFIFNFKINVVLFAECNLPDLDI